MDKDHFNAIFDIAFLNALRLSYDRIKLPEEHVILESWKEFQQSYNLNENQGNVK